MRVNKTTSGSKRHALSSAVRPVAEAYYRTMFESLEERRLLSADAVVSGLTAQLEAGLIEFGDHAFGTILSNTVFTTPIPGVVRTNRDVNGAAEGDGLPNGIVDDKDVHVPDVRDALSVAVDRQSPPNGIDPVGPFASLAARANFANNLSIFVTNRAEKALAAMDLNADAVVDSEEIYGVLVVGAASNFLANGTFTDVADLQAQFTAFLGGVSEPGYLSSLIDLDLTGVSNNGDANRFSYSFTFNLEVSDDQYLLDLGIEADRNEIIFPEQTFSPGSPGVNPSVVAAPAGTRTVSLHATAAVPMSFTVDVSDPPETAGDFSFAVPGNITVAVDDAVAGPGGETLSGLITNVGFLGTVVPGPDSASEFDLHMEWTISITDPSSPVHLGFTQARPIASGTGTITAGTALPNDPEEFFEFPQDVIFDLKFGTQTTSTVTTVTVTAASTTGNTTAADLQADLQTALNAAGLSGLVTAGLTGDNKLTLSLPSTDITPLGFVSNQLFDGTSPFDLTASAPPSSLLGGTEPAIVRFLLSVGGAVPKLVTVTTTPADDDADGMPMTGDEGQLSLTGLLADINNALAAAGLGAVDAVDAGGNVQLEHPSQSLEVTRTISLDAIDRITPAEFNHASFGEFIKATQGTSDDRLEIIMPLNVRAGLDFGPTGTPGIKVDIQPFGFTTAELKLDIAGIARRLTLPLTDLLGVPIADNGSELLQYLDFNVVGPGEAAGMVQQLETWLNRFRDTELLGAFNIPFAQSVLGNLLDFDDMIHDVLLSDDLDDDDDDNDLGRLLSKVIGLDPQNPDTIFASFNTAQELGARLNALFTTSIISAATTDNDGASNDNDFASYDAATRQLTYHIGLSHVLAATNVAGDFTANLDLAPIGNIATQSKVHLQATGHFDAVLGIEMGPGQISGATPLADLNGGQGAGIVTGIAFTGALDAEVVEGRLSADATFDVSVTVGAVTTNARVTVTKAATAENTRLSHLIQDINDALAVAKVLPLPPDPMTPPTLVNLSDRLVAEGELSRILLKALSTGNVQHFTLTSSTADAAYTDLGLASTAATTVFVSVLPTVVSVSSDVTLDFFINGEGTAAASITLKNESTGSVAAGESLTGGNVTLTDLVNDINAALAGTSLNGKVAAARNGTTIVLTGIDGSIESLRVVGSAGPAGEIGFASEALAAVFLIAPRNTNAEDANNVFGRLSADATFDVKLNGGDFVPVSVSAAAAADNTSVQDLVDNINAAIAIASDDGGLTFPLAGKIEAFQAGAFRIGFRAIDEDVLSFTLRTTDNDPAETQMGLSVAQHTASAALRVGAIKTAPAFYGPASNATFQVTVVGGTSAGTKSVTVATNDTLTNATIQDLVGDVRRALDTAFLGPQHNPFLVSNDGNRLLLKLKTTDAAAGITAFSITADVANPAITDLQLYQAGTTLPVSGNVTSHADTADLLIYTQNNAVHRVTLDGDTTIQHVLDDINGLAGAPVTAAINDLSTGLFLEDETTAAPVDPTVFRVDSVNGSRAAQSLGIFGSDAAVSVSGSQSVNAPVVDHRIDGTRIATLQLADRFFVRQVDSSTPILSADVTVGAATFHGADDVSGGQITISGHGYVTGDPVIYDNAGGTSLGSLTSGNTYYAIIVDQNKIKLATSLANAQSGIAVGISDGSGAGHRLESLLSMEASFGFAGVKLTGSGALIGGVDVSLADTDSDAVVRLSSLFEGLSADKDQDGDINLFDLTELVSVPTLSLTGEFELGVETFPALVDGNGDPIIGLGSAPVVTLTLDNAGDPFAGAKNIEFASTDVSVLNDEITLTGHGMSTGMEVIYRNGVGGTNIGGLTEGQTYFVISTGANTIKLAASLADAIGNTPINLTSAGTGTHQHLQGFVPVAPHVNVDQTNPDLQDLINLTDVDFGDLIGALQGLSDFLNQFSAFSFLDAEIPLLGVSFNELVDIADRFETAVSEIVQNPAASVQLVEQKIRETFGLPATSDVFTLSLADMDGMGDDGDLLKVKLNLSKAFSEALNVELDLSEQLPGINLKGSAGLNASGALQAVLTFGVDLNNPLDLYLFTHQSETDISASLNASADNLTFNAALGPAGIFITGGDVDFSLSGSFRKGGGAAGDKMLLADVLEDLGGSGFAPTFSGTLESTLPVFFPTQSLFKGDIEFEATLGLVSAGDDYELNFTHELTVPPDLFTIDFTQISLFDNVILAVDTFDAFLAGVQDVLDGEIFGLKLPLIGDKLSEGAEFINDIRTGVIQPFRELVETAQTQGTSIVQTFLFDLLGPGSTDNSIPGIGLLIDPEDGLPATEEDRTRINDIVNISENLTGPISTNFAQWNFTLGQIYNPPLDFDFDLGFPGLNLDLEGGLDFKLGWTLGLGLGISIADGPYLEITRSSNTDDPFSHTFPTTQTFSLLATSVTPTFENISPQNSDLDATNPNGSSAGRIGQIGTVNGSNLIFYAASEYGGVYKTTDGGLNWTNLQGHIPQVVWDVKVDPNNTNRVYAASFFDGRVNSIAGINISDDAGQTWTHPANSVPDNSGGPGDNTPQTGYAVDPVRIAQPSATSISIRPDAPANVAVGTTMGVAVTHDSGANWQYFDPFQATVLFGTNLFNLDATDTTILNQYVAFLNAYPNLNVTVAGYTDTVGTPADNLTLSQNRANAVRDHLLAAGILPGRITTQFFGETRLAVPTGDEDEEQGNRRVELNVQATEIYEIVYQGASAGLPDGVIDVVGNYGHARSTDGGATWAINRLPSALGGQSLAVSPDEHYVLFAVGIDNMLYESDDAGANWTLLGGDPFIVQGRIPFVATNPLSSNGGRDYDVWFGDVSLSRFTAQTPMAAAPGGAIRGINNNALWERSDTGSHVDAGDIAFDATVNVDASPKLYSNDGGVYRNTLGGTQDPNWEQPNITPHGLYIMGFTSVDQPGADNEDLYVALQDNGIFAITKAGAADARTLAPAAGGWHNPVCCDVFDVAADNDRVLFNNGVFPAGSRRQRFFTGNEGIPGSGTDLGANHPQGAVIDFKMADPIDTWGDDKFAVLTGDTNRFGDNTFGDGGLFITSNIKAGTIVWTELGNATEPNSAQFADLQVSLDAMGVPTFYATVGRGNTVTADQLWKFVGTDPNGAWQQIDTNIPGAIGVSVFGADRSNPDRLYASAILAGNQPQMFRSDDGGLSWTPDLDLDDMMTGDGEFLYRTTFGPSDFPFPGAAQPFQGLSGYFQPTLVAFDPEDSNIIVAGGVDSGVFVSMDAGDTWQLITDPLGEDPNVPHLPRPRGVHFDHEGGVTTLYIASQGGGVWRIRLDAPVAGDIEPDTDEPNESTGDPTPLPGAEPELDDKSIHSGSDIDVYEWIAQHTGNAIVSLYFDNLIGNLDLAALNDSGSQIVAGQQSNLQANLDLERLIFPVVEGTKYYFKVSSAAHQTGFYDLVVQKSVPELDLFIEAGIEDGSTLTGRLAFLQLDVTAVSDNFDTDADADPTHFRADFTVDIFNGDNPSDTRLSLSELGSLDASIAITAEANVNLDLQLGLNDELLPDTISAALPTVRGTFLLDWKVGGPLSGDLNLGDGLKLMEFRDVGLDLGSFLGDTVGPIVAKIQEITGPLQPIVDIVTARIPVLSDLAGRTITLADIAAAFGEFDPALIYAIADIISLVNSIDVGAGDSLFLELGDFKLIDVEHPELALLGGDGSALTDPNFNFGDDALSALGIPDFGSKMGEIGLDLGDLTNSVNLDNLLGGDSNAPAATTTKSLFSGGFSSTPDDSGFAFPIFEDPSQIFGLLLGRNATFITYDLPPFLMDFKWEVSFPIYGPLWGVVAAGVGMKIDLAFGYDTQGIKDFAEGGFQNPLDLIAGFFISDTDKPDGSFGVDLPELSFSGNIGVGAELNAGIASAGVTANIILTVNFDLYDPDHDGKVRIDELVSTFLFEARNGNPALAPIAIFDVFGNIAFQLSAYIKFLFARFDFDITPPIVLFEFSIPFDREPILATERGDGSVLLNIGPNAAARQNGDTRDISEQINVKDAGGGKVAVWSDQFGVPESAAQLYTIGAGAAVVGFGGEGDDNIDASKLTTTHALLEGGSGKDTITGGGANDAIKGDVGDDLLAGGGANDTITGGEGNDNINGDAGNDVVFADTGSVNTAAETGSIRSSINEKDGNDTATGGAGSDIVFGGGGADLLGGDDDDASVLDGGANTDNDFIFGDGGGVKAPGGVADFTKVVNADGTITYTHVTLTDRAGGGADTINAHAGDDVVFAGAGNDVVDGGANNDTLFGESGLDTISGGADADHIQGGTEDDRIFGFRDETYVAPSPDGGDVIFGQNGNDFIRGNKGDDTIEGNAGADVIFGDQDNDSILGQNEPDLIFGGPGRDWIDGGTSNDTVFGDDGFVAWVDFHAVDQHKLIGLVNDQPDIHLNVNNATLDGLDADIRADDDEKEKTLDLIKTLVNAVGTDVDGNDYIVGGEGDDIVLGGADLLFNDSVKGNVKGDEVFGDFDPSGPTPVEIPSGEDILIGDGGRLAFDDRRRSNVRTLPGTGMPEVGNDTVSGNGGSDLIFGGGASDTLYGRMDASFIDPSLAEDPAVRDDDVIIGDDGEITYKTIGLTTPSPFIPNVEQQPEPIPSVVGTRAVFVSIFTEHEDADALATGGSDTAFGNNHEDIIFGGVAGDLLRGDTGGSGNDVILGDNGKIDFALDDDKITNQITRIATTDTVDGSGGADVIEGQEGRDVILGGVNNGGVDQLHGDRATPTIVTITTDQADVMLGDNGELVFNVDVDLDTLDRIRSFRDNLGGVDQVSGNSGSDVLIGGNDGDQMYGDNAAISAGALDGEDIMLGDNGDVILLGLIGRLTVQVVGMGAATAVDLITTTDTVEITGGADVMAGNAAADVILGGVNDGGTDQLYGDRGLPSAASINIDHDDIMLGDNGLLDFTFGPDIDRNTLDLIRSFEDNGGGADEISGNRGADVAIGGTGGDLIFGDDAAASAASSDTGDILLGDNADIFLVAKGAALGGDLKTVLDAAIFTIRTTDEENPSFGGSDTVSGNANSDLIAGGVQGDVLYGDRQFPNATTIGNEGNDRILGDNGAFEWLSTGRLSEITGIDIAANNPALHAKYGAAVADTDLTTLDLVTTEQPNNGDRDTIFGDHGKDVALGGTDSDLIYGDDGNETGAFTNDDVLFGDHGRIYPQFSTLAGFNSRNFFAIDIGDADGGEGDRMFGEEGDDVMLGQQGDDRMWGGADDDDMTGGHNAAGGYDELSLPAINATLNPPVNDLMDGGSGDDAMSGDNTIIWRRGDDLSPRFRTLTAPAIYTTTDTTITANVGATFESDPDDAIGRDIQLVDHSDAVQADPQGRFGEDVMAGGADSDVMFGQLGNDLMQGDGSIASVAAPGLTTRTIDVTDTGAPDTSETLYFNIPEAVTDADDYMEGNGGDDLMYGGLGQDDMIGGSSDLFGLNQANAALLGFTAEELRPDGSDTIFGGAGIRIARNDVGDPASLGHTRDADYIMGDNANVYRLVGANDLFRNFAYDAAYGLRLVPRAMQQLDYTLGGADFAGGSYANGAANLDNGAPDLVHGEDGDDTVFGMTASDVLFANAQDDDVVGGYGHDWISGGTGQDGVIGDDGLVYTSRNGTAEALYNIAATTQQTITTPGNIQTAIINVTGELKKSADITPFSFDADWNATDDEFPDNADDAPFADDVIFGGLGSDFLHGGSGDDAISGAEALSAAFVPVYAPDGTPIGVLDLGYHAVSLSVLNPGNVLAFNPEDLDGQHLNNRFRAGEFPLYDEYDPLRKILLNDNGTVDKGESEGDGKEFLLNFDLSEGPVVPGGVVDNPGPHDIVYPAVNTDGNDAIFGDTANDWLVGGTGRDNMYGGWGNDLLNNDDDQNTNGTLNDVPDTHPSYEDRSYGGAGRDVLIGNTGGDRLIDWVGEYNSYLVPFAPFGMATVSRTLQPFLPEFLYALSRADGADPTRSADTGADPIRNGEPAGEMGLVLQKDFSWQDQTGAPADPQAGNIPGGKRDVLRSANFNDGQSQGFMADSGTWTVSSGRFQVAPTIQGKDAVSVFYVDQYLPRYFEVTATISTAKPIAGYKANSYLIFDYHSPTDFKFAGINISTNKLEMGYRNASGWNVVRQANALLKADRDYNLLLSVNGTVVTLVVDNQHYFTHAFAPRVDADGFTYGINSGMVGLGANNAVARIDNVAVQVLPPNWSLDVAADFSAPTDLLSPPTSGTWGLSGGRYFGAPASPSTPAVSLLDLNVGANSLLDLRATLNTQSSGGFVFDYYSKDDFKFVVISRVTQQVLIGHYTKRSGYVIDAAVSRSVLAGTDYTLGLSLKGTTVSVTLNGQAVLGHSYNAVVTDGSAGLFSLGGASSFDSVLVRTDDPRAVLDGSI